MLGVVAKLAEAGGPQGGPGLARQIHAQLEVEIGPVHVGRGGEAGAGVGEPRPHRGRVVGEEAGHAHARRRRELPALGHGEAPAHLQRRMQAEEGLAVVAHLEVGGIGPVLVDIVGADHRGGEVDPGLDPPGIQRHPVARPHPAGEEGQVLVAVRLLARADIALDIEPGQARVQPGTQQPGAALAPGRDAELRLVPVGVGMVARLHVGPLVGDAATQAPALADQPLGSGRDLVALVLEAVVAVAAVALEAARLHPHPAAAALVLDADVAAAGGTVEHRAREAQRGEQRADLVVGVRLGTQPLQGGRLEVGPGERSQELRVELARGAERLEPLRHLLLVGIEVRRHLGRVALELVVQHDLVAVALDRVAGVLLVLDRQPPEIVLAKAPPRAQQAHVPSRASRRTVVLHDGVDLARKPHPALDVDQGLVGIMTAVEHQPQHALLPLHEVAGEPVPAGHGAEHDGATVGEPAVAAKIDRLARQEHAAPAIDEPVPALPQVHRAHDHAAVADPVGRIAGLDRRQASG